MSKEGGYIIVNMEGVNETGENPGLYELLQVAYTSSKPVLISGFTRNGTLIKDFYTNVKYDGDFLKFRYDSISIFVNTKGVISELHEDAPMYIIPVDVTLTNNSEYTFPAGVPALIESKNGTAILVMRTVVDSSMSETKKTATNVVVSRTTGGVLVGSVYGKVFTLTKSTGNKYKLELVTNA